MESGQNEKRIKVSNQNGRSKKKTVKLAPSPSNSPSFEFDLLPYYNSKHLVSQFSCIKVHNPPAPAQPRQIEPLSIAIYHWTSMKIKEHNTYLYIFVRHIHRKIWYKKSHGHWFAQIYQLVSLFCLPLQQKLKTTHKINK